MKQNLSKKQQFVEAVRLMVPGNEFITGVARLVPKEALPPIAGVAGFELTATLETLCKSWRFRRPIEPVQRLRGSSPRAQLPGIRARCLGAVGKPAKR